MTLTGRDAIHHLTKSATPKDCEAERGRGWRQRLKQSLPAILTPYLPRGGGLTVVGCVPNVIPAAVPHIHPDSICPMCGSYDICASTEKGTAKDCHSFNGEAKW